MTKLKIPESLDRRWQGTASEPLDALVMKLLMAYAKQELFTQVVTLPVAVLGWNVPETKSLVPLLSYTDPTDSLGEDSPSSPWAVWLLHRGKYDLYTTWRYNGFFDLFSFFFKGDRMHLSSAHMA